jgi:hypothetical protein
MSKICVLDKILTLHGSVILDGLRNEPLTATQIAIKLNNKIDLHLIKKVLRKLQRAELVCSYRIGEEDRWFLRTDALQEVADRLLQLISNISETVFKKNQMMDMPVYQVIKIPKLFQHKTRISILKTVATQPMSVTDIYRSMQTNTARKAIYDALMFFEVAGLVSKNSPKIRAAGIVRVKEADRFVATDLGRKILEFLGSE